jgi:hypothetical protein
MSTQDWFFTGNGNRSTRQTPSACEKAEVLLVADVQEETRLVPDHL